MSTCNLCGATGLIWHENMRCLVSEITGKKHGYNLCLIKIPRFDMDNGIALYRRPERIAADIVKRCLEAGKNVERAICSIEGDFVVIR